MSGNLPALDSCDHFLKSKVVGGSLYSEPNTNLEPLSTGRAEMLDFPEEVPRDRGLRFGERGMNPKLKGGSGFWGDKGGGFGNSEDSCGICVGDFSWSGTSISGRACGDSELIRGSGVVLVVVVVLIDVLDDGCLIRIATRL